MWRGAPERADLRPVRLNRPQPVGAGDGGRARRRLLPQPGHGLREPGEGRAAGDLLAAPVGVRHQDHMARHQLEVEIGVEGAVPGAGSARAD